MEINQAKDELIDALWLPAARRVADVLRHPLTKNKELNVFTLTNARNCREITRFAEDGLTDKELVIAWNSNHIVAMRIETDIAPKEVITYFRYEDRCCNSAEHPLAEHAPLDVLNMDFSSQGHDYEARVEKELESIERTIQLQGCASAGAFLIVYTTILADTIGVNPQQINARSDETVVRGWAGLQLDSANPASAEEKADCLRDAIVGISRKHGYGSEITEELRSLGNDHRKVYSLAVLLLKEGS